MSKSKALDSKGKKNGIPNGKAGYAFGRYARYSYLITPIGVYIINFKKIAYHPSENEYISLSGKYIIIAKEIQPVADDIHLR